MLLGSIGLQADNFLMAVLSEYTLTIIGKDIGITFRCSINERLIKAELFGPPFITLPNYILQKTTFVLRDV